MVTEAFTISHDQLSSLAPCTTLITGGSAGIGLETALTLHKLSKSNNIAILDRSPPDPSTPASLISSPHFLFHQCDITSWSSQRAGFEATVQKFGAIDNVYVNAGIAEYEDQFFIVDLDHEKLLAEPDRRTITVDMIAASDTVKLAIHYIRTRQDRTNGGNIVLTASLAGYLASAGAPLYSAAKHATLNISVSVVAPGITLTNIVAGRKPGQSLKEWAADMKQRGVPINTPAEVARAVVWLMSQGMRSNGKGLVIQAGRFTDVEAGIAKSRNVWMGEEQLKLFRGGRKAPLFPNKL